MTRTVVALVTATAFARGAFLLGFRVGGRFWHSELQRTRFEAARAERRLHDLSRDSFVAMAEHADTKGSRQT